MRYFAIALSVYYPIDILGWLNYVNWAKPIIDASRDIYEERRQYFEREKLNFASAYISWRWQLWRFLIMLCMIAIFDVICFDVAVRQWASIKIQRLISDASVEVIFAVIPGVFYLVYVLITESWMWLVRLKTNVSIEAVDSIKQKYELEPSPTYS